MYIGLHLYVSLINCLEDELTAVFMMVQLDGTPESSKLLVIQNFVSIKRNISLKENWPKDNVSCSMYHLRMKRTRILEYLDNYHTPLHSMLS